jgi:hypothetical protein
MFNLQNFNQMKKLLTSFTLLLFIYAIVSCKENVTLTEQENSDDLKKMTVEAIWAKSNDKDGGFTMSIKMKNLTSERIAPPRAASYEGISFFDNGEGPDEVAGDLIYTSDKPLDISTLSSLDTKEEILLYSKNLKSAKVQGWEVSVGMDCDEFCVIGHGEKCCGKTCDKSIFGGTAWFCIGACGCKSSVKVTYKQ